MNIICASVLGFCFGVRRAVELAEKALAENPGKKVYSLGPLIHNENALKALEEKGLHGFGGYTDEAKAARALASDKSMPLSTLAPSAKNGVYFGIIAKVDGVIYSSITNGGGSGGAGAAGSPLPGGLQMALIAGLFGLGFWYVRRRKAIAD